MAPLCSEPRQLLVVLNTARRKALYQLVAEITARMRSELELDDGRAQRSPPSSAPPPPPPPAGPQLVSLRAAAAADLDRWRRDFHGQLKELLAPPDDGKLVEERQKRQERIAQARAQMPPGDEGLLSFGPGAGGGPAVLADPTQREVAALQRVYQPVPTRLATLPVEDRKETLGALLLLLLSAGKYTAYARVFATRLASSLELPLSALDAEEAAIAESLVEASSASSSAAAAGAAGQQQRMTAEAEAQKRKRQNKNSRFWKVGLASVAGAAVIGITGGLAAPVVAGAIGGLMGSVGLGGVASFLGIFWMNGALVGTLFGAFGARMTGEMMDKYAREVEDFRFLPLQDERGPPARGDDRKPLRRLRVTIGVNGWLTSKDEVTRPWRALGADSEVFALRYEMESLLALGRSLEGLVSSHAWSAVKVEILRRTVLATLWSALWPAYMLRVASSLDNPFSLARNRSEKAGRILADALVNRAQGERPVTLVGYSLGARVICACLRELAERRAFGLVDTVVLVGAPAPSSRDHWRAMRSAVAGRLFNVYSENDYILAFLYRATSAQLGVAGLQAIRGVEGVVSLDLSDEVKGHLRYPELLPQILTRCGFEGIAGGEGPIEGGADDDDDDDEARMRDAERGAKTGTLIGFGDEPGQGRQPPPPPPLLGPEDLKPVPVPVAVTPRSRGHRNISFPTGIGREEAPPVVTKVAGGKTKGGKAAGAAGGAGAAVREPPGPCRPEPEVEVPGPFSPLLGAVARRAETPPPPYRPAELHRGTSAAAAAAGGHRRDEPEEDEEGEAWGGIRMVDEDHHSDSDMVTYLEPLQIVDEDGGKGGNGGRSG